MLKINKVKINLLKLTKLFTILKYICNNKLSLILNILIVIIK